MVSGDAGGVGRQDIAFALKFLTKSISTRLSCADFDFLSTVCTTVHFGCGFLLILHFFLYLCGSAVERYSSLLPTKSTTTIRQHNGTDGRRARASIGL